MVVPCWNIERWLLLWIRDGLLKMLLFADLLLFVSLLRDFFRLEITFFSCLFRKSYGDYGDFGEFGARSV
jgi:hypothetical protein